MITTNSANEIMNNKGYVYITFNGSCLINSVACNNTDFLNFVFFKEIEKPKEFIAIMQTKKYKEVETLLKKQLAFYADFNDLSINHINPSIIVEFLENISLVIDDAILIKDLSLFDTTKEVF